MSRVLPKALPAKPLSFAGQRYDTNTVWQTEGADELKVVVDQLVSGQQELRAVMEVHFQSLRELLMDPGRWIDVDSPKYTKNEDKNEDKNEEPTLLTALSRESSHKLSTQTSRTSRSMDASTKTRQLKRKSTTEWWHKCKEHSDWSSWASQGSVISARAIEKSKSNARLETSERSEHTSNGVQQNGLKRKVSASRAKKTAYTSESLISRIVHSRRFEMISGVVILVNLLVMFAQLQWQSCEAALSLGRSEDDCGWSGVNLVFEIIEYGFNIWYLVEMALRFYAHRREFFHDKVNVFDGVVVCMAFVQHATARIQLPGTAVLRVLRFLRAVRVVRIVRLLNTFRELHILLKTLALSCISFVWSMCIIAAIVWAAGLLVMQLLESYIQDPSQDVALRDSLYLQFGTPVRAVYSMFVATFSTAWVPMAQEMIVNVNPGFGAFWVLYIVIVNFAVIRVMAAIFLKQTMEVAAHDAERRAMEFQKHRERFAKTLHHIFARYDTSGDGKISREEFDNMVSSRGVQRVFARLGLDHDEVLALFGVMISDDGYADYEEFLTCALKLKSSARTLDSIQILHELGALRRTLRSINEMLGGEEEEDSEKPEFGEGESSHFAIEATAVEAA